MRKLFSITGVSALLALGTFAQQKDESATKPATETSAVAEPSAPSPNSATATRGIFAIPALPKATPFPGPQEAAKKSSKMSSDAPGRLLPRYELNAGFGYMNTDPGSPFDGFGKTACGDDILRICRTDYISEFDHVDK